MEYLKLLKESDDIKKQLIELVDNAVGAFFLDPVATKNFYSQLIQSPFILREAVFFETFNCYLSNVYDLENEEKKQENLRKLSEILAENIPNGVGGYEGESDKLRENVKRIIKIIDDVGTKQKAIYIANLTRAVIADYLDINKFFKLCNCVRILTEEDLKFLETDIPQRINQIITKDRDNIDDLRSVGLLYEVDGGFSYSKRAYDLLNFSLIYEGKNIFPESLPKRKMSGEVWSVWNGDSE